MVEQQKVTIELPDWVADLPLAQRRAIGDDIVQFIRDRCAVGQGVRRHGNHFRTYSFPAYSKEYAKAKGQTRVDLVLSEEMLSALDSFNVKETSVDIGYRGNSRLQGKVEGNRIGSYGGSPNPAKARDFLGVTNAELAAILAPYKPAASGAADEEE